MTSREKELTIKLLTEKIERITGKKIKFLKEEEGKVDTTSLQNNMKMTINNLINLKTTLEKALIEAKNIRTQEQYNEYKALCEKVCPVIASIKI